MPEPDQIINYLGLGGGGGLLVWLAWKFVFRNATDQSALATISGNFELMAKNLREQLEEYAAKNDALEAEIKSIHKDNLRLKAENIHLRAQIYRLKHKEHDRAA